jgi:hypothetical protein
VDAIGELSSPGVVEAALELERVPWAGVYVVAEVLGRADPRVLKQAAAKVRVAPSHVDGYGCSVEDVAADLLGRDEGAHKPGAQAIEAVSDHEATTSSW